MYPCGKNNIVRDNRTWYSPNWTKRGEVAFCDAYYHNFIKNTPLSIYIRNDGQFEAAYCCFKPSVEKEWRTAVSNNDIKSFIDYVNKEAAKAQCVKAELELESVRY